MERRRRHGECKDGKGGCEVVVGQTCGGPRRGRGAILKDWMRKRMLWVGNDGWCLAAWAAVVLLLSLILNVWVIMDSQDVYGLLLAGEGLVRSKK